MDSQSKIENRKSKIGFWRGVFAGNMMMLVFIVGIIMLSNIHPGPTPGEQLLTCTGQLGMATARLNALESRASVIYEPSRPDEPVYNFHNLVEIRPGSALQSPIANQQSAVLRPRWIVLPGEEPMDLWKSETVAWAVYHINTRQVDAPTIVQVASGK